MRSDDRVEFLPLVGGQLLGIIQTAQRPWQARFEPGARENDRRGHYRPSQWTAAGLIHARHEDQSSSP